MWWYVPSIYGILDASWHATFLVVMVVGFQWVVRKKLPARWRFALWLLVLVRLSGVALPESRLSVFNWVPRSPVVREVRVSHVSEAHTATRGGVAGGRVSARAVGDGGLYGGVCGWVVGAYLLGVGVMGVRVVVSMWRVRGVVKRSAALEDGNVRAWLVEARRVMGVDREVPVVVSEEMGSPALVGWWRPVMVVPGRLVGELTNREWEFVFLHECAHLRRNDVLVNYWMAVLGAVHWFNPVAWLVWPRVRADRELACDEQVVMATGEAGAYGETLLKMFDGAARRASFRSPAAVGVIGTKAFFKRRIQMIAAFRKRPAWLAVPAVGMLLAVGAATLTSAVTVVAAEAGAAAPKLFPAAATQPDARAKALDTVIPDISMDGQPLEKVLQYLADNTGLNVVVNWQALINNMGVDKRMPVTIHVKNVPLHKVLDVVLEQVNSSIGYEFSDNVLMIAPSEMLAKNGAPRSMEKVVRVYNVRDLVGKAMVDAGPAQPGQPIFQGASPMDVETAKLEALITGTVDPGSWAANRGNGNSIGDFHGMITVTATQEVQSRVAELLENLRTEDKEGKEGKGK